MKRVSGRLAELASGRQDLVLAIMLLVAVFMMIIPLPTLLVDLLIAINLALSVVLLMIAIYLRDPLEFSVFPAVLLITTLYRLALTISTSRLILLQHDAGEIVTTFGRFAVGGNLVVGLIVFTIITIVQFIVITKGSERVAEVGARFSLDGMPGKQMSIDGDMRAGTIDAAEARRLRALVQKESQLYGAMDGAMKFVKGDAIAGIIVILVNILGGIAVGVFMHGMSAAEAGATYVVLSVGDGLIAQIPALLISVTAGIIVTRVPGEVRQNLARDLGEQIGRQPQALWVAAAVLLVFALIPGFPGVIFMLLAALAAGIAWRLRSSRAVGEGAAAGAAPMPAAADASGGRSGGLAPGALPLILRHAPGIVSARSILGDLDAVRSRLFERLGVPLPEILLQQDASLAPAGLQIQLYQETIATLSLPEDGVLIDIGPAVLPPPLQVDRSGRLVLEWFDSATGDAAAALGANVHRGAARAPACLERAIMLYAAEFIGVQETRFLMDAMEVRYGELVKELQRQLPVGKVADVLQRLVDEGVSIRDLRAVFEALVEWSAKEKDAVMLTEYVRIGLRRHIIGRHRGARQWISAWSIGGALENTVRESIRQTAAGSYSTLGPEDNEAILERVRAAVAAVDGTAGRGAVLLTAIDVRRFMRKIVEREFPSIAVLSFQELGDEAEINMLGHIDLIESY
ncbi:EscV/YscV/HrcV family type III secretion system export apparatus protein [Paludibacterium yongneupense]|uniref:EscV/YscV/HrcV family type III secretion system export apparatus protein n=1 Tax=Paludibacterium yongneupense TaxID=400061 RepID=UPI00041A5FA2|nr:EscV/YscV/HrcV family type III secretion system export apparatus protein [Paludibacterium yongneupense]